VDASSTRSVLRRFLERLAGRANRELATDLAVENGCEMSFESAAAGWRFAP
jgi:hypothetical protein